MIESIVSYGLAVGAVYALIGITCNVMFSASRVFSFTSGMLGMLGGVLGALFITRFGLPVVVGLGLVLACGAGIGVVTEIVTVGPVLKSREQHLYVLSTLAFALMVQQLVAIEWGTDAQPFPRLIPIGPGLLDQQFWLPMLACAATIVGLEFLYRRTLIGRAFVAIAEDSYTARALGLPEQGLRMASFALAGMVGMLAGFTGGEMVLGFFRKQPVPQFLRFRAGGAGRHGVEPRRRGRRPCARSFPAGGKFSGRRHLCSRRGVRGLHCHPAGQARRPGRRCHHPPRLMAVTDPPMATRIANAGRQGRFEFALPWLALAVAGAGLPLLDDSYVGVIAQRACIYWILVAGLNLVVGFAGQIAIGWVALLTGGAYPTAALSACRRSGCAPSTSP